METSVCFTVIFDTEITEIMLYQLKDTKIGIELAI